MLPVNCRKAWSDSYNYTTVGAVSWGVLLVGKLFSWTYVCFAICVTNVTAWSPTAHGQESGPNAAPAATSQGKDVRYWDEWLFPQRQAWRVWGQQHVQTGDLVFTRGSYPMFLGAVNFSDVICKVCDGELSHVGIAVVEEGQVVVYDITDDGMKCTPFGRYVNRSSYQSVSIYRPRPEYYAALPKVVAYLREHYRRGTRFDHRFQEGEDRLYCSELVVNAYRHGGVPLCTTIKLSELPGLRTLSPTLRRMAQWKTGLEDDTPLYVIGNSEYGIIGSVALEKVLGNTPLSNPPR